MTKPTIAFLITLLAIVAAIALIGILFLIYRNVQEPVATISQTQLPPSKETMTSQAKTVSGSFTEIDLIHKGRGQAVVYLTPTGPILRLENFSVTPGPDLLVYLSKESNFATTRNLGDYVSLGKLQKFTGEQTYILPPDYRDYPNVIIWCRAFSTLFSFATLQ